MKRLRTATLALLLPLSVDSAVLRGGNEEVDADRSRLPKQLISQYETMQEIHDGANIFRDRPARQRKPHEPMGSTKESELTARTVGQPAGDFSTLECNVEADLTSNPCTETWTSLFGRQYAYSSTLVVPCGRCIRMDVSSPIIALERGIDIQGKLVIPDGYQVIIKTPFVLVQGEIQMTSTKIPDGMPDVRIILTGTDEQVPTFQPADSNSDGCGGEFCAIGKKPFIVAGGRLQIEGLRSDTPTWVNLYDVVESNKIVLPRLIRQRWGIGSEVLITSHTLSYKDEQVRTIVGFSNYEDSEYVVVELNRPIRRPTTIKDTPDFAVEVALLSRNFVFEGDDDDPKTRHGAHMIVYRTPQVQQKLEGVEFRNFGQQGSLGRYPIHFHLCGDVSGSIVSKNLIRDSNQRCVVVHGSHNLLVESNVAYDTRGHCFMTEDGNEQGNVFRSNLGALTLPVRDVIPDMGSNGEETDDQPSTFWMTNPTNTWEGNVAAGSEFSGFWLELRPKVRGPSARLAPDLNPMKAPLILFKNNVAHSNRDKGIRTYPDGYIPDEEAVFHGSRIYRNEGDGFWLHHTHNVAVDGGIYADNRRQVDFDRADKIAFRNAQIIGITSDYHAIMESQSVPGVCSKKKALAGIQFHSFTRDLFDTGAVLENITLSGFGDSGCSQSAAFDFDDQVERGSFDFFTTLSNISIEQGTIPINFCEAENVGIQDIYITDLDSSTRPSTINFKGTSSIVSNSPTMTTFLPKCVLVPEQCYAYCIDACLRTVTYAVDPAGTEGIKLKICRSSDPTACIEVSDSFYYDEKSNDLETVLFNSRYKTRRFFAVTLPPGSYVAKFVASNGNDAWPTFVQEEYEVETCPASLSEGSIRVVAPPVAAGECDNLIRNGDADESNDHAHWLHRQGGIAVAVGEGIGGTNAFVDIRRRDKNKDGISQFLDSRCVNGMVGRQYELKAWVKLVEEDNNKLHLCDVNREDCPEIDIYTYLGMDQDYKKTMAETVVSYTSEAMDGYQLVHGVLDMTSRFVSATSVMLGVHRNVRKVAMFVDNVSVELLPALCGLYNLVRNGDFRHGDSRFWQYKKRSLSMRMLDGSNYAAQSRDGEIYQYIATGCMSTGERYAVSARFQLLDDGRRVSCGGGTGKCPVMKLQAKTANKSATRTFAEAVTESNGEWYTLRGAFVADDLFAAAESIRLSFDDVPRAMDLILDDVVMKKESVVL